MHDKFINYITKAVSNVFSTMISLNPVPGEPVPRNNITGIPGQKDIIGIMGICGTITASIVVHFEKSIALKATSNMLGVEYTEIDSDVKDAVGEITNMISGAAKAEFSNSGIDFRLSLPIVICGKDFETGSLTGDSSILIPFEIDNAKFFVEFSFKE